MGHSSINVSLTYLRGLEVAELREEDGLVNYYAIKIQAKYLQNAHQVAI